MRDALFWNPWSCKRKDTTNETHLNHFVNLSITCNFVSISFQQPTNTCLILPSWCFTFVEWGCNFLFTCVLVLVSREIKLSQHHLKKDKDTTDSITKFIHLHNLENLGFLLLFSETFPGPFELRHTFIFTTRFKLLWCKSREWPMLIVISKNRLQNGFLCEIIFWTIV